MKKILLVFVLFAFTKAGVFAQYPDLPDGSSTFNPQTLPVGSYIIAMDNTNQRTGSAGSLFNIKAYGAIVHLLNNNKRLRWVIQPGKAKDGIDITVANVQMTGTAHAGTSNFRAGPFVIFQPDTAGVVALINAYNGAASSDDVKLYKTTAAATFPATGMVDVRYDYLINGVIYKPKAAVLDDGGNGDIHAGYFVACGIIDGISTPTTSGGKYTGSDTIGTNWEMRTSPSFVTNCFTFASEPHNDPKNTADSNAIQSVLAGIKTFINNGGNFLAQCHAIHTYENFNRSGVTGFFQSTTGINDANSTLGTSIAYPNPSLSFSQYEGAYSISKGGSIQNWRLKAGSAGQNGFHKHARGLTSPDTSTVIGASVSKLITSSQLGGMVSYIGNHIFSDDLLTITSVNGLRMYMNAFLQPTNPQGSLVTSAVVHCSSFGSQTTADVSSASGPANAYPLTFKLYEDFSPPGLGGPDVQLGSTVTFTAAGQPMQTINSGQFGGSHNYYVLITPAGACLQPKILQSVCSTLPVSLLSFNAFRNGPMVNLKWTTASEQNNRGFNIERLLGNGNWEIIGFVASQAQGGNSSDALNYAFTDPNNFKGISQYRLQQVDFDNRMKQSEIRMVRGEDQIDKVIVFPNPSEGKVSVLFGDRSGIVRNVTLFDMSGRAIKQWNNITINSIQIENLLPGMYNLRILIPATGEQTVEKIVVNKR